jgi:hypothetical protein
VNRSSIHCSLITIHVEPGPDRRELGRILAFADFTVDVSRTAAAGKLVAGLTFIDPLTTVFGNSVHAIIPPRETAGLRMMKTQSVA